MATSMPLPILSHRAFAGAALTLLLAGPATAQITERVSVDSSGTQGNSGSFTGSHYALTDSARYIAFVSDADNLVSGDTNGHPDVFVHDRLLGVTSRVSLSSSGEQGNQWSSEASISDDGRFVAFASLASNLVPNDSNQHVDAFVHDRVLGTTIRASLKSDGSEVFSGTSSVLLSGDGNIVMFVNSSPDLVPNDTNGKRDVFTHDLRTRITTRVSVSSTGTEANHQSFSTSISHDGRFLCFSSSASNLVPGDQNGSWDAFLRDCLLGTTTRVSLDSNGQEADKTSHSAGLSDDGRFVGFNTFSPMVPDDTNDLWDAYVRDLVAGTTTRVGVDSFGNQGNERTESFDMSPDGRFITIWSEASNLVPGDNNGTHDAFVHDRITGETRRISVNSLGDEGDARTLHPTVSDDGRLFVFASEATNFVVGDTNGSADVFVRGRPLTLDVSPASVAAGDSISIATWTGEAGAPILLTAVELNGAPIFSNVALSTFDATGTWILDATVPSGLSGNTVTLQAFGVVSPRQVDSTNRQVVVLE